MKTETGLTSGSDVPVAQVRAATFAAPRRPIWICELLQAAKIGTSEADDGRDDLLAALAVMYDQAEIHAVIKDVGGQWTPAPSDTLALVAHIDRALQELGREPVTGEVAVVLAASSARRGLSA
jgi:hypothetical protein